MGIGDVPMSISERLPLRVVDASVLLAILLGEPEAEDFSRAIAGDPQRLASAVTSLEAARKGPTGRRAQRMAIGAPSEPEAPLMGTGLKM